MAKTDKLYGTGRRKKSIARVYLVPGKGNITINKRTIDDYFGLETLKVIVRQPLVLTETTDKFDLVPEFEGVLSRERTVDRSASDGKHVDFPPPFSIADVPLNNFESTWNHWPTMWPVSSGTCSAAL